MKLSAAVLTCATISPLVCVGCATLINGPRQSIELVSNPAGACVFVQPGDLHVRTPVALDLARGDDYSTIWTLEGYRTEARKLRRELAPAAWLNILLGGFVGLGVDVVTGSAYRLEPQQLDITMKPVANPATWAHPVCEESQ